MVVVDQALLETLPLKQRVKLCKQLRQEQVKKYNEWARGEPRPQERIKKENKKGQTVGFASIPRLIDATYRCDDREVLQILESGQDADFPNSMGITLLHKCCIDDNVSVAEMLLSHGAQVNAVDDDLWTPLHYASELDHSELVQLLLTHGADVTRLDIDGNFPTDHAPAGSYTQVLLDNHIKQKGINKDLLKELRSSIPRQMLEEIKLSIGRGEDISSSNEEGITLLHIAAANSYREVVGVLLEAGATVNVQDKDGWSPLHCAAKYASVRLVKNLLKHRADPMLVNHCGLRASKLARSREICDLLVKLERVPVEPEAEQEEEEEEVYYTAMTRINSKAMRPRHTSLSKPDQLAEGERMFHMAEDVTDGALSDEDEDADDYDQVYLSFANLGKVDQEKSRAQKPHVGLASDKTTVGRDELLEVIATDDLASMAQITEQTLLTELTNRFKTHRIYTNVGDILIAVNPFKSLPIYSKNITKQYQAGTNRSLPPHIFGLAEQAYQGLMVEQRAQCCIISGESGAGKTESSKYFVQHLLAVTQSEESNLNNRIQQVNPLLEAFGNAQTVMNDNSSRFGKYLELHFSDEGLVLGGRIFEYLLEKSRVVSQAEGELNFHIFYLMFAGLSPDEYEKYGLMTIDKYRYLQSITSSQLRDKLNHDNREQFRLLRDCLRFIGFTPTDLDNLLLSLSAVLHIGNIQFQPVGNNDAAQITNPDILKKVCAMLQVPFGDLGGALVSEVTITRGEQIRKERSVSQASDCRDALAKSLYGRLFSWIVNGINQLIQPYEGSGSSLEIGVLDIFGFENFPENSFEQLCINLANEQLQSYFSQHIFELELEDCAKEGVPVLDLSFTSNKPTLDLFLKKPTGILSILDEESRFPKATDATLATKLHDGPGKEHPGLYLAPKHRGTEFSVMHYAGKVTYTVDGVLEKNRDTLPTAVMFTMKTSDSLLIKEMFHSKITRTGSLAPSTRQQRSRKKSKKNEGVKSAFDFFKKKRTQKTNKGEKKQRVERPVIGTERRGPATLAFHFKNSLAELMAKMNAAQPHFVRCIKPNMNKVAGVLERDYVLAQLRYTGVHQTISIRQQGYALRLTAEEFIQRYPIILLCSKPKHASLNIPAMEQCKQALSYSKLRDYKIGKTKLFFRYWHVEKLAEVSHKLEAQVVLLQRILKGYAERKKFGRLLENKKRQEQFVETFLECVELFGRQTSAVLETTAEQDNLRHSEKVELREKTNLKRRNEDVRKSLEHLDQILDQYDDSPFSEPPLPPPPPELLANRPESLETAEDKRLYESHKRPPPVPTRSPDTRLSLSTEQSQRELHNMAVPAPDYEDEQGPESGYITPDPTGSESDFPMFGQPMNKEYMPMHGVTGRGQVAPAQRKGDDYQRQAAATGCETGDPSGLPSHPGGVDLNRYVPAPSHVHAPRSQQPQPPTEDTYNTSLPRQSGPPPHRGESFDYTYQITEKISISSQGPIQKDMSFRGGDEAYTRTISASNSDEAFAQHSREGGHLASPPSGSPAHKQTLSPTSQGGFKLIPDGNAKPLRKTQPPPPPKDTDTTDPHVLPFKVQLKPVGPPKNSKSYGLGVQQNMPASPVHLSTASPTKAPVPLPKPRSPSPPPPPPPAVMNNFPPPPPPQLQEDFPAPPPPSFSPPPPPPISSIPPPPPVSSIPPPPPISSMPPPPTLLTGPPPPPPPPLPNGRQQGPPAPPPPAMGPPVGRSDAPALPPGRDHLPDLLSQLQSVTLTTSEKPSKSSEGHPEAHDALINQIQSGIKLKPTPGGKKLTDTTEPEDSQISSQSKQELQSDAVETSGRDEHQAASAPLTDMLNGQATQAPPTGKAEPVREETQATDQTTSGKTQASGEAKPEKMLANGKGREMPPTPVVTVTMYTDEDAAGKSGENRETAKAVVRSESEDSSITVESVKTSVVVTAATSTAERDNGSSSPEPTINGVTTSSPVHRESPEFPAERKQSTSSSSSSETSSPSKLPPPTAPKSGKASPPNQGKMPTSRTDNLAGDIASGYPPTVTGVVTSECATAGPLSTESSRQQLYTQSHTNTQKRTPHFKFTRPSSENTDITSLPGFQNIPDNCPGWKKAMIEKKNMQLLEDTRRDLIAKKVEEEKWRDVPEWKRSLILEKERKKKEENEPMEAQRKRMQEEENRLHNMPGWKKNLVLKKKD